MTLKYVLKRFGLFLLVVWGAATLNFFIPRLAGGDPVEARLVAMSVTGGYTQTGIQEMVKAYQQKFGLDQPLWKQYLSLSLGRLPVRFRVLADALPRPRD